MPTFVLERYLPGVSHAEAEAVLRREAEAAAAMAAAGRAVHVLHATLVEGDESVTSVVEAPSRADVVELGERAGAPADRIVPAVALETSTPRADGIAG